MTKLISLDIDQNIKVSSYIKEYLNPDYIFLPIKPNSKFLVKNQEHVLKNQPIMTCNSKIIFSSISGTVVGSKTYDNKKYLVIENNFKEKPFKKIIKKTNFKTKEELELLLSNHSLNFNFNNKKYLLLNLVNEEPYIINNTLYMIKNMHNTLECLDLLKSLYNFLEVGILIKNIETYTLEKLNEIIGTYPDIKIFPLPNLYLIGRKEFYKTYIPFDLNNTLEISINELDGIFNSIYKNKPKTEKYITISGKVIKTSTVVNAKIGSLLKDVINESVSFIDVKSSYKYIINGLMTGYETDLEGVIVDENLEGIIITDNHNLNESKCINCGLCNKVCPLKLDPKKSLKNNNKLTCLNCGLCTYICPSNINFKNITIKGDYNE